MSGSYTKCKIIPESFVSKRNINYFSNDNESTFVFHLLFLSYRHNFFKFLTVII